MDRLEVATHILQGIYSSGRCNIKEEAFEKFAELAVMQADKLIQEVELTSDSKRMTGGNEA